MSFKPTLGTSPRENWIDVARGTAMLLVIWFHASSLLYDAGYPLPRFFQITSDAVAPYRIPMLMVLSGMFLPRSLAKGAISHLDGKFRNILWPYAIWLLIFCIVTGRPGYYLEPLAWKGGSYLWYMGFLLAYFLLALPLRRVPPIITAVYALAISILVIEPDTLRHKFMLLMVFFFVGAQFASHGDSFRNYLRSKQPFLLLPLFIATVYYSAMVQNLRYDAVAVPIVIAAMTSLMAIFYRIQNNPLTKPIAHIGRRSLIYYAVHIPVMNPFQRYLREHTNLDDTVMILLTFVVGMAACVAFDVLANRFLLVHRLFFGPDLLGKLGYRRSQPQRS